jgi:hypothetical protein
MWTTRPLRRSRRLPSSTGHMLSGAEALSGGVTTVPVTAEVLFRLDCRRAGHTSSDETPRACPHPRSSAPHQRWSAEPLSEDRQRPLL